MRALLPLLSILLLLQQAAGQCLEHDAVPPECSDWVNEDNAGEPFFFPHQFNCSKFWVCEPDLTDCLHECAAADQEGGVLYFDFTIDHDHGGPVCNWPWVVDCENKPSVCGECQPWQECVECVNADSPDCHDGWTCTPDCKLDVHCNDDEYCDFNEGGEGNCQKGCRNGKPCAVDNNVACGVCENHVCNEPECCTDDDCDGVCENGVCTGCATDADCVETACSTCENSQCYDPECCTDDDCLDTQICDDDHKCKDGCRENSDCNSNMVCAVCQGDNTCSDPECCADSDCLDTQFCDENNKCSDGCNEDSDCTSNMACAFCQDDHTCTDPECCTDIDCPSDKPICDSNVCIAGCRQDSECDKNEGPCNGDYTPEGSSCFYCDMTDVVGSCLPGCSSSQACPSSAPICAGHRCKAEGGTSVLNSIKFTTESCDGCASGNSEGGPVLNLKGKAGTTGQTVCDTLGLDHANNVDFSPNNEATFDKDDDDKELLGTCYLASLQNLVVEATISWTGSGQWSIKNKQIDFDWTGNGACPSSCCVSGPLESGETYQMECHENCLSSIVC